MISRKHMETQKWTKSVSKNYGSNNNRAYHIFSLLKIYFPLNLRYFIIIKDILNLETWNYFYRKGKLLRMQLVVIYFQ